MPETNAAIMRIFSLANVLCDRTKNHRFLISTIKAIITKYLYNGFYMFSLTQSNAICAPKYIGYEIYRIQEITSTLCDREEYFFWKLKRKVMRTSVLLNRPLPYVNVWKLLKRWIFFSSKPKIRYSVFCPSLYPTGLSGTAKSLVRGQRPPTVPPRALPVADKRRATDRVWREGVCPRKSHYWQMPKWRVSNVSRDTTIPGPRHGVSAQVRRNDRFVGHESPEKREENKTGGTRCAFR